MIMCQNNISCVVVRVYYANVYKMGITTHSYLLGKSSRVQTSEF